MFTFPCVKNTSFQSNHVLVKRELFAIYSVLIVLNLGFSYCIFLVEIIQFFAIEFNIYFKCKHVKHFKSTWHLIDQSEFVNQITNLKMFVFVGR